MEIGWGVYPLADRLRRAAFIERQSIRHLCGWFAAAPPYEVKHRFGYHVWAHAEHVEWLRERLRFLRGGHPDASLDPALLQFVDRVQQAPNTYAFIRGAYGVLRPALLAFYRETLAACDPSANAADVRLLRRLIPEIEEQIDWAHDVLAADPDQATSQAWADHLQAALDAIGGLTVAAAEPHLPASALATPFHFPGRLVFDDRIEDRPLVAHDEKLKLPYEDALEAQFRVFFNEIYAAAMLASVLYDGFEHKLPWAFTYDFARHFWDECRHSEFGAVRLAELGKAPDRCNQALFLNSLAMPLLHRVCYLTLVLEPYYMPRKKPRFQEYETHGDARSQLFADHDWSDEINHVRLGKDWLQRLLEDDARDVEQLKAETHALLEKLTGAPVEQLSPF